MKGRISRNAKKCNMSFQYSTGVQIIFNLKIQEVNKRKKEKREQLNYIIIIKYCFFKR